MAHLAVAQGNHVAKLAAQAAERRLDTALGRKDAVLASGWTAALRVAGDGDAGLATGLGLNLLGDVVHDRRACALGELLLVLLLGQRRVFLGDGTGDGHNGKAAAGLHAILDGLDDVIHVVGDLGNQDDVCAARDAGVQRDPANLVAHDLDNEHASMARSGGVDVVDTLGGDVDGACKTKRQLGAPGVVIDGLGQGDNVEALFAQAVGGLGGAVTAQHKQAVELQLVIGVDHRGHLLDAVGFGVSRRLNGVRLVPGWCRRG